MLERKDNLEFILPDGETLPGRKKDERGKTEHQP